MRHAAYTLYFLLAYVRLCFWSNPYIQLIGFPSLSMAIKSIYNTARSSVYIVWYKAKQFCLFKQSSKLKKAISSLSSFFPLFFFVSAYNGFSTRILRRYGWGNCHGWCFTKTLDARGATKIRVFQRLWRGRFVQLFVWGKGADPVWLQLPEKGTLLFKPCHWLELMPLDTHRVSTGFALDLCPSCCWLGYYGLYPLRNCLMAVSLSSDRKRSIHTHTFDMTFCSISRRGKRRSQRHRGQFEPGQEAIPIWRHFQQLIHTSIYKPSLGREW